MHACHILSAADNVITAVGARTLVDALQLHNITLKAVDLAANPCTTGPSSHPVLQELQSLLQRNRVIKKAPGTPSSVARAGQQGYATIGPATGVDKALLSAAMQAGVRGFDHCI